MDLLALVKLTALMERTRGSPDVKIGLIDGPLDAGARVINLSLALARPSAKGEGALEEALNQALRRGVIVVAARAIRAPLAVPPSPATRGLSRSSRVIFEVGP